MFRCWRVAFVLGLLFSIPAVRAQTADPASPKASLSGVVRDANTGAPIQDAEVRGGLVGSKVQAEATTDSAGRFTLADLDVGQVQVRAFHFFLGGDVTKVVSLTAGKKPEPVELRLRTGAHISGRVTDPDGKPLAGIFVRAYTRVYSIGKLEYVPVGGDDGTNSDGEYFIDGVEAGRGYIIQAIRDRSADVKAISDAPQDPAQRKPILATTYFPSVDSPERAIVLNLGSNDTRAHTDIEMLRSPTYCVEGAAQIGDNDAEAPFALRDQSPSVGTSRGVLGPGGKFRICDLYPGEYSLTLNTQRKNGPASNISAGASVTILDRDAGPIKVTPAPATLTLSGQVVWDGTPPTPPAEAFLTVQIQARAVGAILARGIGPLFGDFSASPSLRVSVPGTFSFDNPRWQGDGLIRVINVPAGAYVKDITYNGESVLYDAWTPASSGNFVITLGQDGARIGVKAVDKDGNPAPESSIALIPRNTNSESALSITLRSGKTDAQGAWTSELLPPGKYLVVATDLPLDQSFEAIDKLWLARGKAQEVELTPGGTVAVTLIPEPLN